MIEIGSADLCAVINPLGAELSSLKDVDGRELMTDADPAFWSGRAPILFPIVGRLNGDRLRVDGQDYTLEKHGFARRSLFDVAERSAAHALFRLVDSEQTRALYPFRFLLEIGFAVEGATLRMTAKVGNIGDDPLPTSFGWHPAFAWPLPYGAPRADHQIVFERDEPAQVKRITPDGYSTQAVKPSPVPGRAFTLADPLFEDDALVWDPIASRSLRYGPPQGPWLDIAWDAPRLGLWTKPGARYVCVEPWHGIADPEGFDGDFRDKPGVFQIVPGASWACEMHVTLTA